MKKHLITLVVAKLYFMGSEMLCVGMQDNVCIICIAQTFSFNTIAYTGLKYNTLHSTSARAPNPIPLTPLIPRPLAIWYSQEPRLLLIVIQ